MRIIHTATQHCMLNVNTYKKVSKMNIENITIGQIATAVIFVGSFIGAIELLLVRMKKWIKNSLKNSLKDEFIPIEERLNKLSEQNRNIELSSDKNFLVHFLSCVEQGNIIDEVEIERFYETYKRYHELGGNSYIDHKVEKLKKEGKL